MKILVIGAGQMGTALAYDLARSQGVESVTLADVDASRAHSVAAQINAKKIRHARLDVEYFDDVISLMSGHDCAIGATTFRHNFELTRAALEAGVHFCDLGGNDDVVRRQLSLDAEAKNRNILVVPNCGLAPGFANVLAAGGAKKFDELDTIHIRVGGLPQHPKPPLNYQLVFSAEGLVNEYSGMSVVLREGKPVERAAMTELEELEFPPPFGLMEAFLTSGGASMLPAMFESKVRELDYKTIRYPGHCEKFKTLLDIGFASNEPISVGSNLLTAKEMFLELLKRKLGGSSHDVVLVRVVMTGTGGGIRRSLSYNLIDFYQENDNISAMMRMT
ncbi:MAG TPA: saccharopine dehydrogenase C-terminal domain-containing protein, partial [Bacteroidota bacterium]